MDTWDGVDMAPLKLYTELMKPKEKDVAKDEKRSSYQFKLLLG